MYKLMSLLIRPTTVATGATVAVSALVLDVLAQVPGTKEVIEKASLDSWESILVAIIVITVIAGCSYALKRFLDALYVLAGKSGDSVREYVMTSGEAVRQLTAASTHMATTLELNHQMIAETLTAVRSSGEVVGKIVIILEHANELMAPVPAMRRESIVKQDATIALLQKLVDASQLASEKTDKVAQLLVEREELEKKP